LGIATLTACFVNSNRDPKKSQPAKPRDFFYFAPKDGGDIKIPSAVANAFFSLAKDSLLPDWAVAIAPVAQLRECKNGTSYPRPRAWIGEGVVLVLPKISGDEVEFALGLIDGAGGVVEVRDADTGTEFSLSLPSLETQWILDGEFTLKDSDTAIGFED
jgi:hypothetical protein